MISVAPPANGDCARQLARVEDRTHSIGDRREGAGDAEPSDDNGRRPT